MRNLDLYYIGATIAAQAVLERIQWFADDICIALGIDSGIIDETKKSFLLVPPFYAGEELAKKIHNMCWAGTMFNRKTHPLLSASFSMKGLAISREEGGDLVYFEITPRNQYQYFEYVESMRRKMLTIGCVLAGDEGQGRIMPRIHIARRQEIASHPPLERIVRSSYIGATLSFTPSCSTLFRKNKTGGWRPFSLDLDQEAKW